MFSADLGVNKVAATPAATDPPFQKVALLLHGDGTNGAQNNTFVDSSTNNFTITRTGNVAQGTFSPFSLAEGQWSNYFNGDGSGSTNTTALTVPDNAAIRLASGDFTVECFFYLTALPTVACRLFQKSTTINTIYLQYNTANNSYIFSFNNGTQQTMTGTIAVSLNTWNHIALTRSGNLYTMWINGVSATTLTSAGSMATNTDPLYIGNNATNTRATPGYISNFRIVNGTALYTSTFTPPTASLTAISGTGLLICQSNSFKDNSSNNFTITANGSPTVTAFSPFAPSAAYSASTNGGSGYWDGATNSYLTTGSSSSLNAGSGDFTVEAFVYYAGTLTGKYNGICAIPAFSTGLMWRNTSGTSVDFYIAGNAYSWTVSLTQGQWYHFAITRQSGTVKLYINGIVQSTTYSNSSNVTPNGIAYIGNDGGNGVGNQYISNFRYVVGTAVYTSNFTPPTAPLTAVSGTQLLLNCTNAGIFDNAIKNDIESVGDAQISTSVVKYGTGSMYFDGTGDYLKAPVNEVFNFGTGDFTIEAWIYLPVTPSGSYAAICDTRFNSAANGVILGVNSSKQAVLYIGGTTYNYGSIALNTWTHVAVSRSSGTNRVFINGTQAGSVSNSYNSTGNKLTVGWVFDQANPAFNGYIDDLRITKGQALYTSNFTPPTQAFPNV